MGAYNDDVLFIHVPKCAGWSVKRFLKQAIPGFMLPDDPEAKLPIGHVPLRDIERWTGRKPESFAKIIGVVRNPYEQQLSQWMFWRDRFAQGQSHIHDYAAASHPTLTSFLLDPMCDFHVWYEQNPALAPRIREPDNRGYANYGGMWMYWLSIDGEIPDNVQVLRQESLGEELPIAIADFVHGDMPKLQRLNTTKHDEALIYHTHLSVQLVEHKCKWAFDNYYKRLSEKE